MTTYTINFTNNSGSAGNFCVFQQNPNSPNPGVFTLAWRTQFADAGAGPAAGAFRENYFGVGNNVIVLFRNDIFPPPRY